MPFKTVSEQLPSSRHPINDPRDSLITEKVNYDSKFIQEDEAPKIAKAQTKFSLPLELLHKKSVDEEKTLRLKE